MNVAGDSQSGTILDEILQNKIVEVVERKKYISLTELVAYAEQVNETEPPRDFKAALRLGDHVALIAEVKKASPSKGVLKADFDHVAIAKAYVENGASAISVLTDTKFFQGDLKYLFDVHQNVDIPILCKDFIIDPYQVYAARVSGADAVLLIVAALTDVQLAELHALVKQLDMTALVEVHNEAELQRALRVGAEVIGINNRNLNTFEVDLNTTKELAVNIPEEITVVAESGVFTAEHVQTMSNYGAHAVLVGEALITSDSMAEKVVELSAQKRSSSA